MHDITVTGLNIVPNAASRADGSRLLAFFDADVNGIKMLGCSLIRTARGGFVAFPPVIADAAKARRSAVTITNPALQHQMMEAARAVYRMMGGADGEWTPHS